MQELLRELKCANNAKVAGFCTLNSAGAQFDLFEGLGTNSLIEPQPRRRTAAA
jgi:hypothetical protein